MALAPYTITALAESDAEGTGGSNIIASAVVSFFDASTGGSAQTLYDNAASANPSTTKTTDAEGQVTVWMEPGNWWLSVNSGTRRLVTVTEPVIKTDSATDTTAGSVPIHRDSGGIFGIGANAMNDINVFTTSDVRTGFFRNPADANIGGNTNYHTMFMSRLSDAQGGGLHINDASAGIPITAYLSRRDSTGTWRTAEVFTDDNLSTNEFGGNTADDCVAFGCIAVSSTLAVGYLPISSYTTPTSTTVISTFKLVDETGAAAGTGITSIVISGAASNKIARVNITSSGLTTGEVYELRTETASSKITVNF